MSYSGSDVDIKAQHEAKPAIPGLPVVICLEHFHVFICV